MGVRDFQICEAVVLYEVYAVKAVKERTSSRTIVLPEAKDCSLKQ